MRGGTQLQIQEINYARRNAIKTVEDKLCVKERNYDSQKINDTWRNVNTTPKGKICTEEREYDSKR